VLYSKMTKIAKTEPGVIYYSLARNSTDPTIFHFFEHYADKAAFEAHTSREETQTILKGEWFKDCVARFEKPIV
jgi:quinol monooxygenase YgiN